MHSHITAISKYFYAKFDFPLYTFFTFALKSINQSISQSVKSYSSQKKYIQPNLGIKYKQTVHILTLVDLKDFLRGCSNAKERGSNLNKKKYKHLFH